MSAQHTYHPDTHTHGLADNCPRCAELADKPWFELDVENLRNLLWRAIGLKDARSNTEQLAMKNVIDVLDKCGAMYKASPEIVVSRLMDWV